MQLRIKDVSKSQGVSITKLAELVGITQPNMSNIANGKTSPSLDLLERIAVALGVEVTELFAKRGDFVAFVRRNGETRTFDKEADLIDYTETLKHPTE